MPISALNPASPQAGAILWLWNVSLWICGSILAIVTGSILYIVIRFRRRDSTEPPQTTGNRRLEIAWTAVPILLVAALFVMSIVTARAIDRPIWRDPDVVVVGHQWWWEVRYPAIHAVTANEIHIPVDRDVLIAVESADVIHDFWVPRLGRKIDAIPGRRNFVWIQAREAAEYLGACAEYCGAQHAWMRFRMEVQSQSDYQQWLGAQAADALPPADAEAELGRTRFGQLTCVNCHNLRGVNRQQPYAPDLTHLASRKLLAAGLLPNTAANLRHWLHEPNLLKPSCLMPNLQLSNADLDALTAYLGGTPVSDIPVTPGLLDSEYPPATRSAWLEWVSTVDHKRIGILYLLTTLFFFCIGGLEALLMRIQLAWPGNTFLSPDLYDQIFTMHGTTMIFLVVVPVLLGLANYLTPLMIGARDMALPRLNAFSFWMFLFGGILLYFSFVSGHAPAAGWFSYTPLSEKGYSSRNGLDYWALALLGIGTGTIATAINLIVTIVNLRTDGMTLRRLPLFVWMVLVNSFLILFALPALNATLAMLLIDRQLSAHFFTTLGGGSPILWQHYFWAFGHPEVYIMVLPAFGIISEVIPVFSRKPIFGYGFVAASTVAIALLSLGVWAHHMFAVGLGHAWEYAFGASSLLIAVPTGVKVFNWIATMWGGAIRFTTSMLFAIAFLFTFTIGGLTGVQFATVPLDWQTTDTYFVVAHMHYVLFGGTLFAVMAGLYYWFPKFSGRMLSERLGKLQFWLTFVGFHLTFFVQHILGLDGMPRRVYTYPDLPGWAAMNLVSSIGAFVLGIGVLVLLVNMAISRRSGAPAGDNPWDAWTLEWATASPPPEENFESVPPVSSARPLWDLAHPSGGAA